jgi:AcrR family transcriptional regulator
LLTAGQRASLPVVAKAIAQPAFRRLEVDERRAQLLEVGARLFTERGYQDVAMSSVASEAGISKALLYHYFASKRDFFLATLEAAAAELAAATETDPAADPLDQLTAAVGAYLAWIEAHSASYIKLLESAGTIDEVRSLVDLIRLDTADRIVRGLTGGAPGPPELRTAVRGWLWFMDGACLDWLENRDLERDRLRDLLVQSLFRVAESAGQLAGA